MFIVALVWLAGLLAAGPLALWGGVLVARRCRRGAVAVVVGLLLGVAAAPAFLIGAYLFWAGWPAAIVIWAIGGAWHRFIFDVRRLQIGTAIVFTIALLAVSTRDQATERYGDPGQFLLDGAVLLSVLAATVVLMELGARSWTRRWRRSRRGEQPREAIAA